MTPREADLEAGLAAATKALKIIMSCRCPENEEGRHWSGCSFVVAQEALSLPAVKAMAERMELVGRVVEAAREYTKNREYQNVDACRKDQDRFEDVLLKALDALATHDKENR